MPRVNIYLPDELALDARRADLNVSALAQGAIRQALAARATNEWLSRLSTPDQPSVSHEEVLAALDAARDEPTTWHG